MEGGPAEAFIPRPINSGEELWVAGFVRCRSDVVFHLFFWCGSISRIFLSYFRSALKAARQALDKNAAGASEVSAPVKKVAVQDDRSWTYWLQHEADDEVKELVKQSGWKTSPMVFTRSENGSVVV